MSTWSRLVNVLRGNRVNKEIDEELASHLEEAMERGRNAEEARRAFGSAAALRDEIRDVRVFTWFDSLRGDAVFGWRQLKRRKVTSGAAILSLALAIGACTSAFRLIDALLLRPMPVAHPEQLYALVREGLNVNGKFETFDGWAYPSFVRMSAAVKDQAELLAISYPLRVDLTY